MYAQRHSRGPECCKCGVNGSPSISTYVIGVGPDLTNLNQIAMAGGTGNAYIVDSMAGTTDQFIDALDSIRMRAGLACEFQIPQPAAGASSISRDQRALHGGTGLKQQFIT